MKILYHDNPADAAENPAYYYYQIMDILDTVALANRELTTDEIYTLNFLRAKDGCAIEDMADANDCYTADDELCSTWDEMVIALRGLFESGERVPI